MGATVDELETKFRKSLSNKRTENSGLVLLLSDARFQLLDLATKRRVLEMLPVSGEWGTQTFDAVMTPEPAEPLTITNIDRQFDVLTLVEMKTTKKPIKTTSLNGFFFGATDREYQMARALGDKYKFAFCVLNDQNDYGHPFFVLLTLAQVETRTRAKRLQYQVNFKTDMADAEAFPHSGWGPSI